MQIVRCKQGSDEWHNVRLGRITASRFKDVLCNGKARTNYMNALVYEIVFGEVEELFVSSAMREGTEKEPYARYRYSKLYNVNVQEVGFCILNERVGVSPDGLVGTDGLVEIKCPQQKTFNKYIKNPKGLKTAYNWQVQGQMWVTGRQWCDIFAWQPEKKIDYVTYRVQRDNNDIKVLEAGVNQFIKELNELLKEI